MKRSVETRIGTTFVLLMQLRVLVVGVTVLVDEKVRGDPVSLGILAVAALISGLVLAGWERVVPRLFEQPALLAFDVLIGYAVLHVGGIFGPYFLVTVVSAGLAGLLYRWQVTALLCTQQTVLYYTALYKSQAGEPQTDIALPLLLVLPAFYAVGALVGVVLRRLYDEHAAAEEARWQMEAQAMAAEERSRLAGDMHDSLTATLAGISLTATGLPVWVRKSPERAETEARRIATAAQAATREARALISELREDAAPLPLDEAVRDLAREWERASGVPVSTGLQTGADLPPRARYQTVMIVKEALENVRRHAEASRVEIGLTDGAAGLEVSVRDDGRGLAAHPGAAGWLDGLKLDGHYGLVGMHERAGRAGARLLVTSAPGDGTAVTVSFPREGPDTERAEAVLGRL